MRTGTEPIRVFILYSNQDTQRKEHLVKALKPLIREQIITLEFDTHLPSGIQWDHETKARLKAPDIIIPLLSKASLGSHAFHNEEMTQLFLGNCAGTYFLLPIVVEECEWKQTRFNGLSARIIWEEVELDDIRAKVRSKAIERQYADKVRKERKRLLKSVVTADSANIRIQMLAKGTFVSFRSDFHIKHFEFISPNIYIIKIKSVGYLTNLYFSVKYRIDARDDFELLDAS